MTTSPKAESLPSDLTGLVFGRLTVIGPTHIAKSGRPSKRKLWKCRCSCGGVTTSPRYNLTGGKASSCGCYAREVASQTGLKMLGKRKPDARTRQPEYLVYKTMVNRCHNPSSDGYRKYGAKGVAVCPSWRANYENFISDMGRRPCKGMTIERLDVFGDYEPGNCVWATPQEQAWNKRESKLNHEKAAEIRRRRAAGETLKSIATDFGIHLSLVSLVAKGKCWVPYTELPDQRSVEISSVS